MINYNLLEYISGLYSEIDFFKNKSFSVNSDFSISIYGDFDCDQEFLRSYPNSNKLPYSIKNIYGILNIDFNIGYLEDFFNGLETVTSINFKIFSYNNYISGSSFVFPRLTTLSNQIKLTTNLNDVGVNKYYKLLTYRGLCEFFNTGSEVNIDNIYQHKGGLLTFLNSDFMLESIENIPPNWDLDFTCVRDLISNIKHMGDGYVEKIIKKLPINYINFDELSDYINNKYNPKRIKENNDIIRTIF